MPVDLKFPHIEKPPDGPARLERLPRIRVAQIIADYLAHGWSADEIHRQYPHLELSEIHSAFAYYYDHREEIDRELEEEQRECEAIEQSEAHKRFVARVRQRQGG